jgi:flagellar biosynthesis regulator FlaF
MDTDAVDNEDHLLPETHAYLHVTVLGRAMLVLERGQEQGGFAGDMLHFFDALEYTENAWTRWILLLGMQNNSDWHRNQAVLASMDMQVRLYRLHVRRNYVFVDLQ